MSPPRVRVLFADWPGGPAEIEVYAHLVSASDPRLGGQRVTLATGCHAEMVAQILEEVAAKVRQSAAWVPLFVEGDTS